MEVLIGEPYYGELAEDYLFGLGAVKIGDLDINNKIYGCK